MADDITLTERPEVAFAAAAQAECLDIAEEITHEAQALAPKRTGELAAGFRALRDGTGAAVVNPVRYWKYVEFGTSSHAAQPHLRPAVDITRGRHT